MKKVIVFQVYLFFNMFMKLYRKNWEFNLFILQGLSIFDCMSKIFDLVSVYFVVFVVVSVFVLSRSEVVKEQNIGYNNINGVVQFLGKFVFLRGIYQFEVVIDLRDDFCFLNLEKIYKLVRIFQNFYGQVWWDNWVFFRIYIEFVFYFFLCLLDVCIIFYFVQFYLFIVSCFTFQEIYRVNCQLLLLNYLCIDKNAKYKLGWFVNKFEIRFIFLFLEDLL